MEGDKKSLKNSSHTNRFVCVADIYTVIGIRKLFRPSDPLFIMYFLEGGSWKLQVLLVATVYISAYYLPVSYLPPHFLSLFPLTIPVPPVGLSPGREPRPFCLHLCPLNPAHMGQCDSTLFLSDHPSSCFHSCVLCLRNLCSCNAGRLFPSHLFFLLLSFFDSTHEEFEKFLTPTKETAVHLALSENTVFLLSR